MTWNITKHSVSGNTTTSEAHNDSNGDSMRLVASTDGVHPSYEASFEYEHPLTDLEIQQFNDSLLRHASNHYQSLQLPSPQLLEMGSRLKIQCDDIRMDGLARYYNLNGTMNIGPNINAHMLIGALNGSAQVSLTTDSGVLFVMPGGTAQATAVVDNISIHRSPIDGAIEASFNGRVHGGAITTGSRTFPYERPPRGKNFLYGLPLTFDQGTIAVPAPITEAPVLESLGQSILASYLGGVDTVMAMGDKKWLCLRHGLQLVGAGWLCAAGIILASGGTVVTGGAASPALIAAMVACFGGKAMLILDLVLSHLGFA